MAGEIAGKPIVLDHVDDEAMLAYFDSLGIPRHASDIVPQGPIPWSSDDMVTFGRSIREGFFDPPHGSRRAHHRPQAASSTRDSAGASASVARLM